MAFADSAIPPTPGTPFAPAEHSRESSWLRGPGIGASARRRRTVARIRNVGRCSDSRRPRPLRLHMSSTEVISIITVSSGAQLRDLRRIRRRVRPSRVPPFSRSSMLSDAAGSFPAVLSFGSDFLAARAALAQNLLHYRTLRIRRQAVLQRLQLIRGRRLCGRRESDRQQQRAMPRRLHEFASSLTALRSNARSAEGRVRARRQPPCIYIQNSLATPEEPAHIQPHIITSAPQRATFRHAPPRRHRSRSRCYCRW